MKFLAIILALAIFVGSPASVFSEEQEPRVQELKRKFQECWNSSPSPLRCFYSNSEFLQNVTSHFDHQGALVRQSDVIQAVKKQAFESVANITTRFSDLGRDMPMEVKEAMDLTIGIPTGLAGKLFGAIQDFSQKMEPATRELYNALEPIVGPHAQGALEKAAPYATAFRGRLQEMGQNQSERLRSRLDELESLAPQIKNLLGYLQELQVALQSPANQVQEMVREKVAGAFSVAKPYVRPVLDAANERTAELRKWAPNPFFVIGEHEQ